MLVQKPRGVADKHKHWGEAHKLEAVKSYLMLGTINAAAALMKIPEQTMYYWSRQPWWQECVAELKLQDQLVLSSRLKRIVDRSFDVIEDRLEHGDFVYDQKSGAMRRKPVSMRDAHKVALELDNKRTVLLDRAVPTASEEAIDDKLNKLAQKFADIVNGKKPIDDQPIDVHVKEVHDNADENIYVEAKLVPEGEMVPDEAMASEVLPDDFEGELGDFLQEDQSASARPNGLVRDNG